MRRHAQDFPWKVAGRIVERQPSGDQVVRKTGWVFNNETGHSLTLDEFVKGGDVEVSTYLELFGISATGTERLIEIGCGIGRMTCAFTRRFGMVIGCDLDAGFLQRCREVVYEYGRSDRLRTIEVVDGRTLDIAPNVADYAFSYITLQHCNREDALALTAEAIRAVRPGGRVMLNYRSHALSDVVLLPLGAAVRGICHIPGAGRVLSRRRTLTRFAWQANRFAPDEIISSIRSRVREVEVWHHPSRPLHAPGAATKTFEGINSRHWWLVATVQ